MYDTGTAVILEFHPLSLQFKSFAGYKSQFIGKILWRLLHANPLTSAAFFSPMVRCVRMSSSCAASVESSVVFSWFSKCRKMVSSCGAECGVSKKLSLAFGNENHKKLTFMLRGLLLVLGANALARSTGVQIECTNKFATKL